MRTARRFESLDAMFADVGGSVRLAARDEEAT